MRKNIDEFLKEEIFYKTNNDFDKILNFLKDNDCETYERLNYFKYSIFYTNPINTLKEGNIYFLGLNPRGEINGNENSFSRDNNLEFYRNVRIDYCSFLDEDWLSNKNKIQNFGEHQLQKRIVDILNFIIEEAKYNSSPRDVFSTNINFLRSVGENDLNTYKVPTDYFWEYHNQFFQIVLPKIIVCNGNGESDSAYSIVKQKFREFIFNDSIEENELFYSKFYMKSFKMNCFGKETLVLGIPHLSRFKKINELKIKIKKYVS